MGRIKNQEIRAQQEKNEEIIQNIMDQSVSFWGIDKYRVNNLNVINIDPIKFKAAIKNHKPSDVEVYYHDKDNGVLRNYSRIKIKDVIITELNIGRDKVGKVYCNLTVTRKEINVLTLSVDQVRAEIDSIIVYLKNEYGISISQKYGEICYIEIAYTAFFDNEIPLRAAELFMSTLLTDKRGLDLKGTRNKDDKVGIDYTTLTVKDFVSQKSNVEFVLYNKSKQLQAKRKLCDDYSLSIYRFEERLKNKSMVESHLKKSRLFGSDCITDFDIITHLRQDLMKNIIIKYAQRFMLSVDNAQKLIQEMEEKQSRVLNGDMIYNNLTRESNIHGSPIIDYESFLYSSTGGKHGSRRPWSLISYVDKKMQYMTETE